MAEVGPTSEGGSVFVAKLNQMPFTVRTQKMLWGRAAARCSMPSCRRHLVEDATETDDEALIGENCHIVGDSIDGPRGSDPLPMESRGKYENLILMCRVHHRIIDQQVNTYTVERLQELKGTHEAWVRESLGEFDPARQRDDERYAAIVDEWVRLAHLDEWEAWTSWVLGSASRLWDAVDEDIRKLRKQLMTRFWPGRYPDLEAAFANFRMILSDFHNVFHKHAEQTDDEWRTEKFYKKIWHHDEAVYNKLVDEYESHLALLDDLIFELTRAANLVVVKTRERLTPSYREEQGLLLVQRGPNPDFTYSSYVPQYRSEELASERPYPGLENFKKVLATRDFHFFSPNLEDPSD